MWPCKRRRKPPVPLDATGPATMYPHRGGAQPNLATADPAEEPVPDPTWNGPTLIPTVSPLMTPGQIRRSAGDQR